MPATARPLRRSASADRARGNRHQCSQPRLTISTFSYDIARPVSRYRFSSYSAASRPVAVTLAPRAKRKSRPERSLTGPTLVATAYSALPDFLGDCPGPKRRSSARQFWPRSRWRGSCSATLEKRATARRECRRRPPPSRTRPALAALAAKGQAVMLARLRRRPAVRDTHQTGTCLRASATACSSVSPVPARCSASYRLPRCSRAPNIKLS